MDKMYALKNSMFFSNEICNDSKVQFMNNNADIVISPDKAAEYLNLYLDSKFLGSLTNTERLQSLYSEILKLKQEYTNSPEDFDKLFLILSNTINYIMFGLKEDKAVCKSDDIITYEYMLQPYEMYFSKKEKEIKKLGKKVNRFFRRKYRRDKENFYKEKDNFRNFVYMLVVTYTRMMEIEEEFFNE